MDDTVSDYQILVGSGHSPAKALEILLDVKRGDQFCIGWVRLLREQKTTEALRE